MRMCWMTKVGQGNRKNRKSSTLLTLMPTDKLFIPDTHHQDQEKDLLVLQPKVILSHPTGSHDKCIC